MAIYDTGTASLAANGQVTGVSTQWTMPLTLIRVGATLVFKTEPVQIYTISEITSDTSMYVYNPNGETVPAGTGYAILAHDGISVQGLAQDVAETLRYYQSRETEVADAVDAFNNFDFADFESKVTQVNTQHGDVVSIGAQIASDAAQVSSDKDSAAASANSASSDKDAAAASAREAADYAASLDTQNLLRKDLALSDLTNKPLARENLDVYSKSEVEDYVKDNGFVFIEEYGGKDDGVTDNSIAFRNAFNAGKTKIFLRGNGIYAMLTKDIELPEKYEIVGNGKKTEIKYTGNDPSFSMFTLSGGGPDASQWKQGGIFRDVVISSDTQISWIVCRHVQNLDFDRVFFYNCQSTMNNFHYVNFFRCERWGSPFIGRADLNTIQFISESPRFLLCFSSNSPIDVWDTADLTIADSVFFSGDYGVRTRVTNTDISPEDQAYGYPVKISNNVFDAIRGIGLDLDRVAYSTITGNLVSAGRETQSRGIELKNSRSNSITGNTVTYCGDFGVTIDNCEQISLSGNILNGNRSGGLSIVSSSEVSVVGGAIGTSYVRGGYYTQPVGITDPGDNSNKVTVCGVSFDNDMETKIYLTTTIDRGNRIVGCVNVPDSVVSGPTDKRPINPSYGQMYFDVSIGNPIWYNAVSQDWRFADGTLA